MAIYLTYYVDPDGRRGVEHVSDDLVDTHMFLRSTPAVDADLHWVEEWSATQDIGLMGKGGYFLRETGGGSDEAIEACRVCEEKRVNMVRVKEARPVSEDADEWSDEQESNFRAQVDARNEYVDARRAYREILRKFEVDRWREAQAAALEEAAMGRSE